MIETQSGICCQSICYPLPSYASVFEFSLKGMTCNSQLCSPNPTCTWNNLQRNCGTNLVSTTNPFGLTNPTLTRVLPCCPLLFPFVKLPGTDVPRCGTKWEAISLKKAWQQSGPVASKNPKRSWRRSCSRGYGLDLRTNCRSLWQPRLFVLLGLTSKTTYITICIKFENY